MASKFSIEAVFKAVDKLTAPVNKMQNRLKKFTRSAKRSFQKLDRAAGKFLSTLGTIAKRGFQTFAAGAGILATSVGLVTREFSKIENAEAAFTPLLGGANKAKEAVQALNDTAATTPFKFENLAKATSQLLPVMNRDIALTVKTLRMLGDTAGGNAQKLDSITRGFTKAALNGKVDMESLKMIAEAGVPIFTELAESMGVKPGQKFFKMISAGKVSTKDLTKAFEKMTGKGGIFFKGMEISSKTTSGLFSTLTDNISSAAAAIGEGLSPVIKELVLDATSIAKELRAWAKANKEIIGAKFKLFVDAIRVGAKKLWAELKRLNSETNLLDRALNFFKALTDFVVFLSKYGTYMLTFVSALIAAATAIKVFGIATAIAAGALAPAMLGWAAFSALAAVVMLHWKPIMAFFAEIGSFIGKTIFDTVQYVSRLLDRMFDKIDRFNTVRKGIGSGIGEGVFDAVEGVKNLFRSDEEIQAMTPGVVTPSERITKKYEESHSVSTSEVTIKDQTGRAEVTGGNMGNGLKLQRSGAF